MDKKRKPKVYPINDKYRIKSDKYCLVLESCDNKGNWSSISYHPTLESLLESLYELNIRENLDELERMVLFKDEIIIKLNKLIEVKK